MREIKNDPFYEIIKEYDKCVIDYCLLEDDAPYAGYISHKNAVLYAIRIFIGQIFDLMADPDADINDDADMLSFNVDINEAKGIPVEADTFLYMPEVQENRSCGKRKYDCEWNTGFLLL